MAFPFAQISAGAKGNLETILNNTFHLCKLKPGALATLKILSILTCFSRSERAEAAVLPSAGVKKAELYTQQAALSPAAAGTRLGLQRAPGAHSPKGPG